MVRRIYHTARGIFLGLGIAGTLLMTVFCRQLAQFQNQPDALALLFAILFGYYQVSPQDAVNIKITPAVIQGTKEDGSEINGFVITTEDGTEYLVTDYWTPIMLSDSIPEED